ncbi:RUVB1 [Enterospora canceri]|uniref:RuvB-like helicase n=1 Tax=Enterospora canceri TaxID=1081671 RepID=A0A1Y1S7D6_9MICR|nr:RUVB1 [Enterospora canceri]
MEQEGNNSLRIPQNEAACALIGRFVAGNGECRVINVVSETPYYVRHLLKQLQFDYVATSRDSLEECVRNSLNVTYKVTKNAYEGEVTEIRHLGDVYEISLMSTKETKKISLPSYLVGQIELIRIGDVVYCEPSLGVVKKTGRSENKVNEHDLEGGRYVHVPKGRVNKRKEKEITVTLKDIDLSYGSKEKATEFIKEKPGEIRNALICVDCTSGDLDGVSEEVIRKYASEFDCFKFILINSKIKNVLRVELRGIDHGELIRFVCKEENCDGVISTDEGRDLVLKTLKEKQDSFDEILQVLKISTGIEELKENLSMI